MPRLGDVNLTPLEYADSVRSKVAKVSPARIYTYRYIWQKDDNSALSVSVISGSMEDHLKYRESLQHNEHIKSATAEYLSEIDVNYLLIVESVKKLDEKKEITK